MAMPIPMAMPVPMAMPIPMAMPRPEASDRSMAWQLGRSRLHPAAPGHALSKDGTAVCRGGDAWSMALFISMGRYGEPSGLWIMMAIAA